MPFGYSGGGGTLTSESFYNPSPGQGFGVMNPQAVNVLGLPSPTAAPAGTVAGVNTGKGNSAVGYVPAVADPLAAIQKAIQASISGLPAVQNLSAQIAAYNQKAAINQMNAASQAAMQNAITNLPAYQNYAQQIAAYNQKIGAEQAQAAAEAAVKNALANLPNTQALAGQVNKFNQDQLVNQIKDLYPQYGANMAQMGANLADWAAGNVSQSTRNALTQAMAERGVAGGFGPDSGATNAALMSLLGKTSEGLQQQALTGQNTLLAGIPHAPLTDMTSFMVSPNSILSQMGSSALPVADFNVSPNTLLQTMGSPSMLTNYMVSPDAIYNAQQQANLYAAAPNPADAYNLAMANMSRGLNAGGNAARGPYAPTTGTTSNPETLKLLQDLINRGSGTGNTSGTSAFYQNNPYVPAGENLPYRNPGEYTDPTLDMVPAAANYSPTAPWTDEEYWNNFYFPGE